VENDIWKYITDSGEYYVSFIPFANARIAYLFGSSVTLQYRGALIRIFVCSRAEFSRGKMNQVTKKSHY